MENTVILYGSSTGNTKEISELIAQKINTTDIYDVADFSASDINNYKNLILGSSTLGIGDLQDDWESFLPELLEQDLSGKTIAIFGLGDADCYNDSFADAIGIIYNELKDTGAKIVGEVETDDYDFEGSAAVINDKFVGLPIDEDNESDKTEMRIDKWLECIKPHFN